MISSKAHQQLPGGDRSPLRNQVSQTQRNSLVNHEFLSMTEKKDARRNMSGIAQDVTVFGRSNREVHPQLTFDTINYDKIYDSDRK